MTRAASLRCEKNMNSCPLTNCFKCMLGKEIPEIKSIGIFG